MKPVSARWEIPGALLPERTAVMGVVNVTPDSFSDGGAWFDPAQAIAHGIRLADEGADLLDIGGESTRPGGGVYGEGMSAVSPEEEIARVVPVIRGLSQRVRIPLSIDTRKVEVARAAVAAGARVINDVSGFTHAPGMATVAAELGVAVCAMHLKGEFRTMQLAPRYDDLLGDVNEFLLDAARRLETAGVPRARICIDPGFGFGKSYEDNCRLLRSIEVLTATGLPVLIGASRKSFIGKATGVERPASRLQGSVAAAVLAAAQGATVVRVHDVAATVEALRLVEAVRLAAS